MTTFYTADTHFGHARIIELCNRPFGSVEEMDETIVTNFNDVATADDTIYLLGDACMGKLEDSLQRISEINARVVLVPGNHDRPSRAYQRKGDVALKIENQRQRYLEHFSDVLVEPAKRSVFDAPFSGKTNTRVLMGHYPYTGDSHGEDRYADLRPIDTGLPIIHGHVHTEWKINGKQFNVGVDVNNFQLVPEDELVSWVNML